MGAELIPCGKSRGASKETIDGFHAVAETWINDTGQRRYRVTIQRNSTIYEDEHGNTEEEATRRVIQAAYDHSNYRGMLARELTGYGEDGYTL